MPRKSAPKPKQEKIPPFDELIADATQAEKIYLYLCLHTRRGKLPVVPSRNALAEAVGAHHSVFDDVCNRRLLDFHDDLSRAHGLPPRDAIRAAEPWRFEAPGPDSYVPDDDMEDDDDRGGDR